MIDIVSLSADWIVSKQKQYNRDPGLIESMVHALYLLELLELTGLEYQKHRLPVQKQPVWHPSFLQNLKGKYINSAPVFLYLII
jgi:hypothetical protein